MAIYTPKTWQGREFIKASDLNHIEQGIADNNSNKVDKVSGKGLSTNDYTTNEKEKLAGIAAEANKTVVDVSLNTSSSNPVSNSAITAALASSASIDATGLVTFKNSSNT
jgi:hypothetical protein